MGIRVHKSIGWGLELEPSQVDEDRFMALASGEEYLSYSGFKNSVQNLEYPLKELLEYSLKEASDDKGSEKHGSDQEFDKKWSQSFLQCVHGSYDPDMKEDDEVERFLIMTPYAATYNSLSPSLPKAVDEGDEAFLYAEFEALFPDASPYTNQSYTFKTPPFPDSYEVVGVTDNISSVKELTFPPPAKEELLTEISPSLIRTILVGSLLEDDSNLQKVFEDVYDLSAWQLSAPFINKALVEYSGILKEPQQVLSMQPRVLYYWT